VRGVREKAEFDILGRIQDECDRRKWTFYMLSKCSGIPQSTISTWYRKQLQPSVASIEKICCAFGMTLPEFFEGESSAVPQSPTTKEHEKFFVLLDRLEPAQREALRALLATMVE
jgi:transcriptional regulator with XRE-family HTH domain